MEIKSKAQALLLLRDVAKKATPADSIVLWEVSKILSK